MGDVARNPIDVAVIGGGAVGACVAGAVAQRQLSVMILDPSPAGGASSGNAGLIVPSYAMPMSTPQNLLDGLRSLWSVSPAFKLATPMNLETAAWLVSFVAQCRPRRAKRDAAKLFELAERSHHLYREMTAAGSTLGLRSSGWLWCYDTPSTFAAAPETAAQLSRFGATCEVLSGDQASSLVPGLADTVAGALWFPSESVLDPGAATEALLRTARSYGVQIVRERVLDATRAGPRVVALRTSRSVIPVRNVIVAAGADSREVGRHLGVSIPVEKGYGWSITLSGGGSRLPSALMDVSRHVVVSPVGSRIRITGGMQFGGRPGREPSAGQVQRLRSAAEGLVPWTSALETEDRWLGARPMTTTGLPLLGKANGPLSNVYVATGHGPLGMTLAPITGELLAEHFGSNASSDTE